MTGTRVLVVDDEPQIQNMLRVALNAARYEEQIARTNEEIATREAAVQTQQARIRAEKAALEEQIAKRLREERERIASEEARKARMLLADELELKKRSIAELQAVLKERESKLANAQKAQAELLRKERELEDAKREMALTIERKVSESVAALREKAKEEAENASRLKIAEREEQIAGMARQIAELKRRAEQGSQQLQGEVLELQLESLLRQKFPHDVIEPVAKGEFGGDASSASLARRARVAALSYGNPSAPRIGVIVGSLSSAPICARRKLK
jgi:hypothetical protein